MSYQKFIILFCDGVDCNRKHDSMVGTVKFARAAAFVAAGWQRRGKLDLCPRCASTEKVRCYVCKDVIKDVVAALKWTHRVFCSAECKDE